MTCQRTLAQNYFRFREPFERNEYILAVTSHPCRILLEVSLFFSNALIAQKVCAHSLKNANVSGLLD